MIPAVDPADPYSLVFAATFMAADGHGFATPELPQHSKDRLAGNDVDFLLVGDSVGMVVYGFDSTLAVTVEMMIAHGSAVMRGSSQALIVVDMPFGSYQESREQAFRTAARILAETGCGAVKLEGAGPTLTRVAAIVGVGIPVMGHVGLTPQSAVALGGYRVQGRRVRDAQRLFDEAIALQGAGCFAVVLEAMPAARKTLSVVDDTLTRHCRASITVSGRRAQ